MEQRADDKRKMEAVVMITVVVLVWWERGRSKAVRKIGQMSRAIL
jgi:hypothetical protein